MAERRVPGAQPYHHNPVMSLSRGAVQPWGASSDFNPNEMNDAEILYNQTGIIGSAPVTGMTNGGTLGSDFDLDTVVGTGAGLTLSSANGLACVQGAGNVGIKTSTSIVLTADAVTGYLVFEWDGTRVGQHRIIFGESTGSLNQLFYIVNSNQWALFAGTNLPGTSATGLGGNRYRMTYKFLKTPLSSFDISSIGSFVGNAGVENTTGMMLFSDNSSNWFPGKICEFARYSANHDAETLLRKNTHLETKWDCVV